MENQKLQGDIITELKPCPFCGGLGDYFVFYSEKYNRVFVTVKCDFCEVSPKPFVCEIDDPDDEKFWEQRAVKKATMLWNRRYLNGR